MIEPYWISPCGRYVIYNADCKDVLAQLPKVDAVITDPPYEDELHAAIGKFQTLRSDGKTPPSAKMRTLGFDGINSSRSTIAEAIAKASNGWAIIFTLAEGVRQWRDDLQSAKAKYDTCLAWIKPDSAPRFNGQGAARGFECAVTAWCGTGYRSWNCGGKRGVYTHCVNGPSREGTHPTEKPVSLMVELIHDFTQPLQTIADPFLGAGTTMVAAVRLNRSCIGIEIDKGYCDIAVKRVQKELAQPRLFEPEQEVIKQLELIP